MRKLRRPPGEAVPGSRAPALPMAEGIVNKPNQRKWKRMTDDELVEFARKFIDEKGLKGREEFRKADSGLYSVLQRRKLLDKVGFGGEQRKIRQWVSISDRELIAHAQKFVDDNGIRSRTGLYKADNALYQTLHNRKLINLVKFEEGLRNWRAMNNEEIVASARRFVKKKRLSNRKSLEKADSGLYQALQRRKLLDNVGFENEQRKARDWAALSDEGFVEHARRFMRERGVRRRAELAEMDHGMYEALRRRGLLGLVRFERAERSWSRYSDDELVAYAQKFVKNREITRRVDLEKADTGLYLALQRRNLLSRVFAPLEAERKKQAVQQVFDGLKEFGEEE